MINCEIKLNLSWYQNCVISEISRTPDVPTNPGADRPVLATEATLATGQISNAKLQVLIVTLSINDDIKFLNYLKQRFRRIVSWNKYRSEIQTEPKNNNLGRMTDPTFRNINILLVFSFKNGDYDPTRNFFNECFML